MKRSSWLEECLIRCLVSKSLSGSVVQSLHRHIDLLLRIRCEVSGFWEVLLYQSIRFLVCTALPWRTGVCKVEVSLQFAGVLFVPGEFLAVVRSDCAHLLSVLFKQANLYLADCKCGLAYNPSESVWSPSCAQRYSQWPDDDSCQWRYPIPSHLSVYLVQIAMSHRQSSERWSTAVPQTCYAPVLAVNHAVHSFVITLYW